MSDVEAYEVAHGNPFDWKLKEVSEALGPLQRQRRSQAQSSAGKPRGTTLGGCWRSGSRPNEFLSLLTMIMNPDRVKDLSGKMNKA